jgi:hypothetical protein
VEVETQVIEVFVEVAILPNYKLVSTSTLESVGGGRKGGCALFRPHKARAVILHAIVVDGLIPEVDVYACTWVRRQLRTPRRYLVKQHYRPLFPPPARYQPPELCALLP